MSLLFIAPDRDLSAWEEEIRKRDPDLDVEFWPEVAHPERVHYIVSWNHPHGILHQFRNVKTISSLGAGIDHILNDESLPKGINITRIVTASLVRQMKEYVLSGLLTYQHNLDQYCRQKTAARWRPLPNKAVNEIPVGVMGLGEMGKPVAQYLVSAGYKVYGWSLSKKQIPSIETYDQKGKNRFLGNVRVLVCLLPLTSDTEGILDLKLFKHLKHPGYLINAGRGEHLVEEDLIYALEKKWLDGAFLDVFSKEPLPDNHPFWNRDSIMITPHTASRTPADEAAVQIIENYKRTISGLPLMLQVDPNNEY